MKFTVSSSLMHKQLSTISGAIVNNPLVPILENFLFVIKNGVLTATASDLHISMVTEMDVDAKEDMGIAIPAKKLMDTLKNLNDQPITFNVNAETYAIEITSYKGGRYKLAGEDSEDYPKIPLADGKNKIMLTSEGIAEAISRCLFAVGSDDMRPAMTGVFIKLESTKVTFVSTDGNRLIKYIRKDTHSKADSTLIIPKKAMALLRTALPSEDRKSTRLNSSHLDLSRMPSSA